MRHNECAPGQGGVSSLLHFGGAWPALPERCRQLHMIACANRPAP